MGTFYNERHSNLINNHSLKNVNFDYFLGGYGAGGGEPRVNFANTAYWNPTIVTDSNGVAQVSFTIPDSLTKWGIAAWAVTADTKVGEAVSYIQTSKDLKIQTFIPDQIIEGETLEISAKVFNSTETAQNLDLVIKLPETLEIVGNNSIPLLISPGGNAEVKWSIKGKTQSTNNKIIIETSGGSDYDGVEYPINVIKPTFTKVQSFTGFGGTDFNFNVEGNCSNELRIEVIDSFERLLKEYSYSPSQDEYYYDDKSLIFGHHVYKNNPNFIIGGQPTIDWYKDELETAVDNLLSSVKPNGGFENSTFSYDASPTQTIESYIAISHGVKEGLTDYKPYADNALTWLKNNARSNDEKAFVVFLQTEFGTGGDNYFNEIYPNRASLSDMGLASLAIASENLGKSTESDVLIDLLINRAINEGESIHWKTSSYFGYTNETDSNALSFYALVKSGKANRAKQAAQWILSDYAYYVGGQTRSTTFILEKAFIEFSKTEGVSNSTWSVALDGNTVLNSNGSLVREHKVENVSRDSHTIKVNSSNALPFVQITFRERRDKAEYVDSQTLTTNVTLRDANGGVISSLSEGSYGLIAFELNSNTPISGVSLKTLIPSGLEIINSNLANSQLPAEISQSSFYQNSIKRSFSYIDGELELTDRIYNYAGSTTYIIPVRARAKGTFTLGPTNVFVYESSNVSEVVSGSNFSIN